MIHIPFHQQLLALETLKQEGRDEGEREKEQANAIFRPVPCESFKAVLKMRPSRGVLETGSNKGIQMTHIELGGSTL
jgi:hypothetical protein